VTSLCCVNTDEQPGGLTAAAGILMGLVLLWSGGLAAGFVYAGLAEGSSVGRATGYLLIAFFLALVALRTGYEIVRRVRS
jgi:hypothetical protein